MQWAAHCTAAIADGAGFAGSHQTLIGIISFEHLSVQLRLDVSSLILDTSLHAVRALMAL